MPGHYKSGASKGAKKIDINSGNTESGSINAEEVSPGTGSKYNKDGSKRDLGVGWGP